MSWIQTWQARTCSRHKCPCSMLVAKTSSWPRLLFRSREGSSLLLLLSNVSGNEVKGSCAASLLGRMKQGFRKTSWTSPGMRTYLARCSLTRSKVQKCCSRLVFLSEGLFFCRDVLSEVLESLPIYSLICGLHQQRYTWKEYSLGFHLSLKRKLQKLLSWDWIYKLSLHSV